MKKRFAIKICSILFMLLSFACVFPSFLTFQMTGEQEDSDFRTLVSEKQSAVYTDEWFDRCFLGNPAGFTNAGELLTIAEAAYTKDELEAMYQECLDLLGTGSVSLPSLIKLSSYSSRLLNNLSFATRFSAGYRLLGIESDIIKTSFGVYNHDIRSFAELSFISDMSLKIIKALLVFACLIFLSLLLCLADSGIGVIPFTAYSLLYYTNHLYTVRDTLAGYYRAITRSLLYVPYRDVDCRYSPAVIVAFVLCAISLALWCVYAFVMREKVDSREEEEHIKHKKSTIKYGVILALALLFIILCHTYYQSLADIKDVYLVEEDGIEYLVHQDSVSVRKIKDTGEDQTVYIRQDIEGKPVISVLPDAAKLDIEGDKKLVLPDGMIALWEYALQRCQFSEIELGNSIRYIGNFALSDLTRATEITLPEQLQYVYATPMVSPFYQTQMENPVLKRVVFPENAQMSEIAHYMFLCSAITEVVFSDSIKEIGWGAFHGCKYLSKVTIPETMEWIHSGAFLGCEQLTEVRVENMERTKIGEDAFDEWTQLIPAQ